MLEVMIAITLLLMGLLALVSTSVAAQSLRESNRTRRLAVAALESVTEGLHAAARVATPDGTTWSDVMIAAYSPGGNPGGSFAVPGLGAWPGANDVCTVQLVTDETLTDADLGVELGMPRDLDHDGLVSNADVRGTARVLPVVVRMRWATALGNRELVQGIYVTEF